MMQWTDWVDSKKNSRLGKEKWILTGGTNPTILLKSHNNIVVICFLIVTLLLLYLLTSITSWLTDHLIYFFSNFSVYLLIYLRNCIQYFLYDFICSGEELFALPLTDYPELMQTQKEVKLADQLFTLYVDVLGTLNDWKSVLWADVTKQIGAIEDYLMRRCDEWQCPMFSVTVIFSYRWHALPWPSIVGLGLTLTNTSHSLDDAITLHTSPHSPSSPLTYALTAPHPPMHLQATWMKESKHSLAVARNFQLA